MIRWLRYIILAAFVTSSSAWAEKELHVSEIIDSKQNLPAFTKLDKNHDDLISHVEGLKNEAVSNHWDKLDIDLDGNLDKVEFAKLESVVDSKDALITDDPQGVQQYKNGQEISPNDQIELNKK